MVRRIDRGISELARRVRWVSTGTASQMATMARMAAYLFTSGALLVSTSLLLPSEGRSETILLAVAAAAVAAAAALIILFERLTVAVMNVFAVGGSVLVSAVIYYGGSSGLDFRPLYLWVTLYAAYFFTSRQILLQGAVAVAGYTVASSHHSTSHAWLSWLITVISFGVSSALVAILRKRLESLLASEKGHVEELLTLDKMKSEVIAVVSHELRTPLSSVYGAAVTLQQRRDSTPDIRDKLVDIMVSESERLERLADSVLWVSRIDAGRVKLQTETVDLVKTATEIVELTRSSLPARHQIHVRADQAQVLVVADQDKLAQVLRNLIENAVKYSPDGGRVSVRVSHGRSGGRVSVSDEGIGIADVDLERIFEKFERVDPDMANGVSGTGLGLYISRDLARRMGGDVTVESRPGEGSTFHLDLPAGQT